MNNDRYVAGGKKALRHFFAYMCFWFTGCLVADTLHFPVPLAMLFGVIVHYFGHSFADWQAK